MHKRIVVWGAQRYADSQQRWLFVQEQDRLESPTDRSSNLSIARERPSLSSMFSRPSTSSDGPTANLAVIAPFREPSHSREKATGKDKDKKEASKEAWKGMQLNSEEIWCNGWSGRFRVNRKNTAPEAGKGPQQRLNISYIRHPHVHNATNRDPADGPCVTVHKHSKAGAFSISRHYPSKSRRRQHSSQTDSGHSGSRSHTPAEESDAAKKKGSTILLAPRRVQKSYTSTNTTRKLEAHGLLDDNHGAESDRRRKDRDGKGKERMGEPSRHKEKAKSDKKPSGSRKNSVIKATSSFTSSFASTSSRSRDIPVPKRSPDSSEGSSAGSAPDINTLGTSSTTTAVTTPEHSEATSSFGSVNSIEASIYSKETDISDRTISQSRYQRRRSLMDDVDDDSEDERRRRPPSRTPYRETYAALPPEAFENVQQESTGHRLFGWGKSRNNDRNGVRSNPYVELSYNPPWPVATPRVNSETRRGIVDDLNTSFQDVGLLPAIGEIKSSANHAVQKRKRGDTTNATVSRTSKHEAEEIPPKLDILCDIPDDCLYMVLPLWPGETDPGSAKKYPCVPQEIPVEDRTYLLVCYRVPPAPVPRDDHINSKNKQVDKKRSRTSPTSSYESTKREDRSVLLKTFHISARVVVYSNLQGTDIRIPDIGLAVSGPLQDAFDTMPHVLYDGDIVIGICHARSRGVEFVPEGFEKLGLTRSIPNPRSSETLNEEDDVSSMDTLSVPTPMGRAVMEMAWLGGIAVTSFNTTS